MALSLPGYRLLAYRPGDYERGGVDRQVWRQSHSSDPCSSPPPSYGGGREGEGHRMASENFRSEIVESTSEALPLPSLPRKTGEVKEDGGGRGGTQCFKFGISVSGTMRMPAASRPWRTAVDTVTAVGPSPCTQIESTWQGMRLPEVE